LTNKKSSAIIELSKGKHKGGNIMARTTIKNYYYEFEDGYFMWSVGKLKGLERKVEEKKHGKIIEEKIC
jgi:hypothetical protein